MCFGLPLHQLTATHDKKFKAVNVKRPDGISDWIKRARNVKYMPTISDSARYGKEWLAWWHAIQPKSQSTGDEGTISRGSRGDLGEVVVCGPNGLLSVVKSLAWWRGSMKHDADISKWRSAVSDVFRVLENFDS